MTSDPQNDNSNDNSSDGFGRNSSENPEKNAANSQNSDDELKKFFDENFSESILRGENEFNSEAQKQKDALNSHLDGFAKQLPEDAQLMFKTLLGEITGIVNADEGVDPKSPLNEKLLLQIAHQRIGSDGNQTISAEIADEFSNYGRLASLWLDAVTSFLPANTNPVQILRPVDWIDATASSWASYVAPVALSTSDSMQESMHEQFEQMQDMFGDEAPDEIKQLFEFNMGGMKAGIPFMGDESSLQSTIEKVNRTTLSSNVGTSLANLAKNALSGTHFSIPLFNNNCTLIPQNINENLKSLGEVDQSEWKQFVAIRECAAQRLFSSTSWIRGHIISVIAKYASGVHFNLAKMQEAVQEVDPNDLDAIKEIIKSNKFAPEVTKEQEIQMSNLRAIIALIEGWVCYISLRAGAAHLKSTSQIREVFIRELLSKDPAALAFAQIIGFSIKNAKYSKAISFWEKAYSRLGDEKAELIWKHPDNIPNEDVFENDDNMNEFFAGNPKFAGTKNSQEIKVEHNWDELLGNN